jgi:hypothetical protein
MSGKMTSNQSLNRTQKSESKKTTSSKGERPDCFSNLDRVFPMGSDGLRHTPESCLACPAKTDCLRAALAKKQGLKVHSEKLDMAYHSGMIGFFQRWVKKKELHRKMNS